MAENENRKKLVDLAASLFQRGYSCGGAGNISLRQQDDTVIGTPTGSSMGRLVAEELSLLTLEGRVLSGKKPSKEISFHLAAYRGRPEIGAVVHLHSTWLTALSCCEGLDRENALRPFTPYYVMRVGALPVLPYMKPGAAELPEAIRSLAEAGHRAILMGNHGVTVFGKDLEDAVNNAEELEETARLFFALDGKKINWLSEENIAELRTMGA